MNAIAHMAAQLAASAHHPPRRRGMRITQQLRDQIVQARAEGLTYEKIASRLHCSRDTIYKVLGNSRKAAS